MRILKATVIIGFAVAILAVGNIFLQKSMRKPSSIEGRNLIFENPKEFKRELIYSLKIDHPSDLQTNISLTLSPTICELLTSVEVSLVADGVVINGEKLLNSFAKTCQEMNPQDFTITWEVPTEKLPGYGWSIESWSIDSIRLLLTNKETVLISSYEFIAVLGQPAVLKSSVH